MISNMCYGVSMIRTQVLLDRETHELLKRAAAARGIGLSALVRETLRVALGSRGVGPVAPRRYGFTFIGSVRGTRRDVARQHDAVLNRGKRW